ncbi:MAG TPA: HipA domain-containing protein [Pseudobdellovibrionaceae bacterium]|nr:HipA domain-containing protein [Pseudobdellovibrionaceae bacterium]
MVAVENPSLAIFHEDREVAELSYHLGKETFHLLYSSEWLKKGFPLSPHLPLLADIPPENTRIFLENLLPEGDALKTLARTLKIAPSNIYALIASVGRDATGAFSFVQQGRKIETSFRTIPEEELKTRIKERASKPLVLWDGKPRLSLAGVQEKLAVTLRDGGYGFGEGRLASTHILKFSRKDQHLVLNEFFCMKLAEKAGLSVAKVEMVDLGERVLQVERFDRIWKGSDVIKRLHTIDGCQALNAPPEFKYQRIVPVGEDRDRYLGPINVENLSAFSRHCLVPAKAQMRLLRWILFNLIIGNTDNHGKNISYFVSERGYEWAPSYDLVNVTVYEDYHQELAFKIGDTFKLDDVKAVQLSEMAEEMNLGSRFVASQLEKLCQEILKRSSEISIAPSSRAEKHFLEKLYENIETRARRFQEQAALLAKL